ncbi:LVIVD repeat-containing protein [Hymenobacter ruber]
MTNLFPRLGGVLLLALPFFAQAQNVGIGTNSPTQKLDVNGNLRVRSLGGTDTRLLQVDAAGSLSPAATAYPASAAVVPALASTVTSLNNPLVAVSGTLAVVLNKGAGTLSLYDASNPAALVLRGTATGISSGVEVAVSGSTAAVLSSAGTGSVLLYTLGSGAPTLVNTLTPPASSNGTYSGIALTGTMLYATFDRSGSYGYLYAYDVSAPGTTNLLNPTAPCTTCTTGNSGYFTPQTVAAAGNFVAVGHAYAGAALLDVSNPAAITRTGLVGGTTAGGYNGRDEPVALSSSTLCTLNPATAELATYNVSAAGALSLRHLYTTAANPVSVALNGSLAYVACQGSSTLQIIDVSGASAVLRGTVALDASANNVAVTSALALAANASAANDLQVFTQPTRAVVVNPDGTAGSAPTLSSTDFIQNQTATAQAASFRISGSAVVGSSMGIGTSGTLTSPLQVAGAVALPYTTTGSTAGTFTLTAAHYTVRRFGACNNLSIPQAGTCPGRVYVIISSNGAGSNVGLSVQTSGGVYDDVNGAYISFLTPNQRLSIQSDGTDWIVIGR